MTTIIHSYNVVDKAGFTNKLKELTKRFKVVYSLVWGTPYCETIEVRRDEFIDVWFSPVSVEFSFDSFKIEGYNYLGCIKDGDMLGFITIHGNDLLGSTLITDWVKSFETIPCHACNRKHSRKIGHIFYKIETDEFLVFGSSCAKKYFGINFDRILSFFEGFTSKMDDWDNESRGRCLASHMDSIKLLKDAYYIISKYGYTSVSAAREDEGVMPTSMIIGNFRNDPSMGKYKYASEIEEITKDIDFSTVWTTPVITNNPEMNHNIGVIQEKMSRNLLGEKDFGWVSFMVWNLFFKPAPAQALVYDLPEGLEVGDKIENITATFLGFVSYDGSWGVQFINMFESNNIRYKWFSSVNVAERFNVNKGDMVVIKKATIKKFEDDVKFGKSVIITRASIKENDE
jgi:hypothetical protein